MIADTADRLRLLDARLDEAVTRAIELSVRADGPEELRGLGDDIDTLVGDMESLRQGLDEVDASSSGRARRAPTRIRRRRPHDRAGAADSPPADAAPAPSRRPTPGAAGRP